MSDNLVLERLRDIRAIVGETREDVHELRSRIGGLELAVASISIRIDRLVGDVDRIKRRLDLVETER